MSAWVNILTVVWKNCNIKVFPSRSVNTGVEREGLVGYNTSTPVLSVMVMSKRFGAT
jgi:hypothetical protein